MLSTQNDSQPRILVWKGRGSSHFACLNLTVSEEKKKARLCVRL